MKVLLTERFEKPLLMTKGASLPYEQKKYNIVQLGSESFNPEIFMLHCMLNLHFNLVLSVIFKLN